MSNVKYLQRYKDCTEYGFDLTNVPAMKWFEMLKRYDMQYTNRKTDPFNLGYVWGFKDGHIVTANNPLHGDYCNGTRAPEIGYCSYIGITGTRAFVRKVKRFIKKHAEFIKDEAPRREFI